MGPEDGDAVEVTGVVEAGVEHRSVVLRSETGELWQVGAGCAHVVGRRVRVLGRTRPGILTTAMQGTPLRVLEVEVVDGGPPSAPDTASGGGVPAPGEPRR